MNMKNFKKILISLGLAPVLTRFLFCLRKVKSFRRWRASRSMPIIWLDLGSGPRKGESGWITVDVCGSDILHDLRNGIPYATGSVDRIYSSHMLEHIPYQDLLIFLRECYRVLKKGGQLSVCVPNAGYYIRAYSEGLYFRQANKGYGPAIVDTGSLLDQVNYIAYMNQLHNYMFDEENLVNTLKKVPFSSVALRSFDGSLDLESRDFESIYALAIK